MAKDPYVRVHVRTLTSRTRTIRLTEQEVQDVLAEYARQQFELEKIDDIEVDLDISSQGLLRGAEMKIVETSEESS